MGGGSAIAEIPFAGLIRERPLNSLTITEFGDAIKAYGAREGN